MKVARFVLYCVIIQTLIFGLFASPSPAYATAGILLTVTSTVDTAADGKCSLPEAIAAVNAAAATPDCPSSGSPATSTIHFGLNSGTDPGYSGTTGVFTITLTTALTVTSPLMLDGTSQSGYSSSPIVHLNETGTDNQLLTFSTGSDGSTIKGLMFSNTVAKVDLLVDGASSINVQANYFDTDGTALIGSAVVGVDMASSSNDIVGGPNASDRNLFADTGQYGVYIQNDGSNGNLVENNYFGLQSDGLTALTGQSPNGTAVFINPTGGAMTNTTIRGNVITKFGTGIQFYPGTTQTSVVGNYIGVAVDGSSTPGGSYVGNGIGVYHSSSNVIGGVTPADRNVISNYVSGIQISGTSTNNVIEGNYIGTDAAGTTAKPNTYGVQLLSTTGNTIGGTVAGSGNLISGNTSEGIIAQGGAAGARVLGNLIGTDKNGVSSIPNATGVRAIDSTIIIGDSVTPGNNLISGNTDGILLQNVSGSKVFGNQIGLSLDGTAAIPNNTGIYVSAATARIANNWISFNSQGLFLDSAATVASGSTGNCFKGNTLIGVQDGNKATAAALTGNWWGAADGPSGLGTGSGDAVSKHVTFSPFLTLTPAACSLQQLVNSSFEIDADNNKQPDNWTFTGFNTSTDKRDCNVRKSGACSLKLTGNGLLKTASQSVLRSGLAGDTFTFGLWSNAFNVPAGSVYRVQVRFYNGATLLSKRNKSFVTGTHSFQSVSGPFIAPGPYTEVVYKIMFQAPSGTAWFDVASVGWVP